MTAQEAYKKVTETTANKVADQLIWVIETIEKAVENNKLGVLCHGTLFDSVKDYLIKLRYKIEEGGRMGEVDTYISWDLSK